MRRPRMDRLGTRRINWLRDADIRSFFGTIGHAGPIRFIGVPDADRSYCGSAGHIADRQAIRLVHKWLAAGVLEPRRCCRTSRTGDFAGAIASVTRLPSRHQRHAVDRTARSFGSRCESDRTLSVQPSPRRANAGRESFASETAAPTPKTLPSVGITLDLRPLPPGRA